MNRLTVLYDERCALCRRARHWLERQQQWVQLEFLPAASPEARRRFPELDAASTLNEITVVGDSGEVYRGGRAWIICLWACPEHRALAEELAAPGMETMAERFVAWVSQHRFRLGELLGEG